VPCKSVSRTVINTCPRGGFAAGNAFGGRAAPLKGDESVRERSASGLFSSSALLKRLRADHTSSAPSKPRPMCRTVSSRASIRASNKNRCVCFVILLYYALRGWFSTQRRAEPLKSAMEKTRFMVR